MSIDEFDIISPFWNGTLEVVAEGVGSVGYLLEDAADDGLLSLFTEDVLVEFYQSRLAAVVYDDYSLDHFNCYLDV